MHYCRVICRVSSTDQIYKFDRLILRGKSFDNDTQLFMFISILIMTQPHPRDPENRQQNRFSERRFSKKPSYNQWNGKAWLGLLQIGLDLLSRPLDVLLISNARVIKFSLLRRLVFKMVRASTRNHLTECLRRQVER